MVHNVVSNSIKFTPRGGSVTVKVSRMPLSLGDGQRHIDASTQGSDELTPVAILSIEVTDTGAGISKVR